MSVSSVSTVSFDVDSGFTLTDDGGGQVTVGLGSHWYSISVSGQTTLTPSGQENIEFVAGTNMSITTDSGSSPVSITWNADAPMGATGDKGLTGNTGLTGASVQLALPRSNHQLILLRLQVQVKKSRTLNQTLTSYVLELEVTVLHRE